MAELWAYAVPLSLLVPLYLCFRLKQYLCDFLLQTKWMVRGKAKSSGWHWALAAHCAVHAAGTGMIVLAFVPGLWVLAVIDFAVHGAIDRIKASPAMGGRLSPDSSAFWWAFGLDQEAHNLTHLIYVLVIVLAVSPVG